MCRLIFCLLELNNSTICACVSYTVSSSMRTSSLTSSSGWYIMISPLFSMREYKKTAWDYPYSKRL